MQLLILSWEYPPNVIGGLGRHVVELALALAQQAVDIHVVTPVADIRSAAKVVEDGVTVHRVFTPALNAATDIYDQVKQANRTLENYVIYHLDQPFEAVHVHDWLTGFTGMTLQRRWRCPLVVTIHATERGRGRGYIGNDLQHAIDAAERQLIQEADLVIVCSRFMAHEVQNFFHTSPARLEMVPNGVNLADLQVNWSSAEATAFRTKFAQPDDLIIFSVGRLVHEKGIHRLVEAAPPILARYPQARIIIAGKGPEAEHLRQHIDYLGLAERVNLVGFISDEDRNKLFKLAACAIFPSSYEPFGIAALEAMALGCPVVVSNVGGLGEIVTHDETGITIYPEDAQSVEWGITHVLGSPDLGRQQALRAYRHVEQLFNWGRIARLTRAAYRRVLADGQRGNHHHS
jgi:glycosyltransferase involved in cell wall biosynthesis